MLRKAKVDTTWSSNLAYVVGVITADGNLSPDLRHIVITSKDEEMVQNCKKCLGLNNAIGMKSRGGSKYKKYYVLQFGDINFFNFLTSIGLTPRKSLTLEEIEIPDKFYYDFFRGYLDGDGNISITKHPESSKDQVKVRLCSGSNIFLKWIHAKNIEHFKVSGGNICVSNISSTNTLSYGKADSLRILEKIYYPNATSLTRKKILAGRALGKNIK
ncbi:MAG: hypothetical protein KA028_01650 [Candidatus Pacebacteria bacterium]|nr:hypothetical protein [Candidatus Paceibacterota bacterium]